MLHLFFLNIFSSKQAARNCFTRQNLILHLHDCLNLSQIRINHTEVLSKTLIKLPFENKVEIGIVPMAKPSMLIELKQERSNTQHLLKQYVALLIKS